MNLYVYGVLTGLAPFIIWGSIVFCKRQEEKLFPNLKRQRGRKLVQKGSRLCLEASELEKKES